MEISVKRSHTHTDSGNVTLNLFQGLLSCVNVFYVLPRDADPPEAGSMTAFICIRSCRHTDSGKLFFICGRRRGAEEQKKRAAFKLPSSQKLTHKNRDNKILNLKK
jgi:hypothetical protein